MEFPAQMQMTDQLKVRVLLSKPFIDEPYKEIVSEAPEFNTIEGAKLISAVWNARAAHIRLTEVIERIASKKKNLVAA